MSPATLIGLLFALLVAVSWFLMMPKPPTLAIELDPASVEKGNTVTVRWRSENATSTIIRFGSESKTFFDSSGNFTFVPTESGSVTGQAYNDGKESRPVTEQYTVNEPAPVPDPVIQKFSISPTSLKKGETFIVTYKLNDAVTKATLSPPGQDLNLAVDKLELTANTEGTIEYTLVAQNKSGETVKKTIKLVVVDASLANIVKFDVDAPIVVPGSSVKVTWQLYNAVRAELTVGKETSEVDAMSGSQDVTVNENTDIVITAYDSQGKTTSKKITVKIQAPEEPNPDAPITEPGVNL